MLPLLSMWQQSGSDFLEPLALRRLTSTLAAMQGTAIGWCCDQNIFIRLHAVGYRAVTSPSDDERRVLLLDDWSHDFLDSLPRFLSPHRDRQGLKPARILNRIRTTPTERWRHEIENCVWFAVGDAMKSSLRKVRASNHAEVQDSMNILTIAKGAGIRAIPRAVQHDEPLQPRAQNIFKAALAYCGNNHHQCAEIFERASQKTRPNSRRRAALLLADAYRSGEFDRASCHLYYRDLLVSREGVKLGQLIDKLDEMMGLPDGLPANSIRRKCPPNSLPTQDALAQASVALGIDFATDVAGALRKLRDEFVPNVYAILEEQHPKLREVRQDYDLHPEGEIE
jgi:hypothetical protein